MDKQTQETLFAEWLANHHGILHKVANSFAAGADRDDLMQEMLVGLWRAIPSFRQESAPSTFAYRVVHHCALTWVRGQRRRRHRDTEAELELVARHREPTAPDARLEMLFEHIRKLVPIDRSAITMALDGLTHAEIGEVLGCSENAVSVRIHRIRKRLASAMQKKGLS